MVEQPTAQCEPPAGRPVSRRVIEITCGLAIVLIAIGASKIWIEARNSRRADSVVLRRSVQLTLDAARFYHVDESGLNEVAAAWEQFLATPRGRYVPPSPAHEFTDSFMVKFRDGRLDSLESGQLYRHLLTFRPGAD